MELLGTYWCGYFTIWLDMSYINNLKILEPTSLGRKETWRHSKDLENFNGDWWHFFMISNCSLHKKWIFPSRISSVNVTKSAISWKLYLLCNVLWLISVRNRPINSILSQTCLAYPDSAVSIESWLLKNAISSSPQRSWGVH